MAQQVGTQEPVARESAIEDCGCGCGCASATRVPTPLPLMLHRSEKVANIEKCGCGYES